MPMCVSLQLSCGSYTFVSYKLVEYGMCVTTNPAAAKFKGEDYTDPKQHLTLKLRQIFQDVEVQSKCVFSDLLNLFYF